MSRDMYDETIHSLRGKIRRSKTQKAETVIGLVTTGGVEETGEEIEWAWITVLVLLYVLCVSFVAILAWKARYGEPTHSLSG